MRKPLPRIFIPTVSITILKAVLNKLTSLGAWDSQMVCLYKKITIIGAVEYICLMKKNSLFLYYLLVWACLALYLYIDNIANGRGTQPYVWSNLLACYFSFSFCFFGIYAFLLRRKRIHLLIIGLIIAEILFVACRYLIEEVIYLWLLGYGNYDPDVKLTHYLYDNWWRALQPILFSFIAWALLDTFKKERETEQLRKEKIQAELLFLKTQINPHFLYNTLNYMYSLAYPVSDVLANGIIKLSQLMRYMLHNSSDGLIDLKLEIAYIQNYIEIYKLRFGDNFFVNFNINGNIDKQRIASLILIPFVENAFKHGVLDNAANPIMITIDVNDNEFQLRVLNTINYGEKDDTSGIGMANIKRRLSLIYPDAHSLQIVEQKQTYAVSLHIKLS
jgi:two-component system LytT family sensor kinase